MTEAEEATESTEETQQPAQATEKPKGTEGDNAELEKWKALARKNEARAKENAEAAKRLAEIEEANKTEAQKTADEMERLRGENEQLRVSALRATTAAAKGIPAELLTGSTEEEIEASADRLLEFKGTPPAAAPADDQGKRGSDIGGTKQIGSREQLKSMTPEEIVEARKAGQLDDMLGIH